MEQHPVPQHIASYEFRLVGDMTLKQFGFLASGAVVALVFYASPLPWYFKWPGITLFGFLGFAFAFLPIEERPLSQWLVAFVKAVFSPTQYLWEKRPYQPEILKAKSPQPLAKKAPVSPPDQAQLSAYLKTLPQEEIKSPIEKQEEERVQQVTGLFQTPSVPVTPPPPKPTPPPPPIAPSPPPPLPKLELEVVPPPPPTIKPKRPTVLPEEPSWPKKPAAETTEAVAAKPSSWLPFPTQPTQANILVGIVLDKYDRLIEGAILEIRNSQGIPVRALKTNQLGQFRIATPLENDVYEIETEKEGYQFDIIKMKLKGEILQPIEIRAKQKLT